MGNQEALQGKLFSSGLSKQAYAATEFLFCFVFSVFENFFSFCFLLVKDRLVANNSILVRLVCARKGVFLKEYKCNL